MTEGNAKKKECFHITQLRLWIILQSQLLLGLRNSVFTYKRSIKLSQGEVCLGYPRPYNLGLSASAESHHWKATELGDRNWTCYQMLCLASIIIALFSVMQMRNLTVKDAIVPFVARKWTPDWFESNSPDFNSVPELLLKPKSNRARWNDTNKIKLWRLSNLSSTWFQCLCESWRLLATGRTILQLFNLGNKAHYYKSTANQNNFTRLALYRC